jgi:hypothetical protein
MRGCVARSDLRSGSETPALMETSPRNLHDHFFSAMTAAM